MTEDKITEMYNNENVKAHMISQLRKRVRPDRPAERIRELSILRLEEQIENDEMHIEILRAELDFITNLDISELKK